MTCMADGCWGRDGSWCVDNVACVYSGVDQILSRYMDVYLVKTATHWLRTASTRGLKTGQGMDARCIECRLTPSEAIMGDICVTARPGYGRQLQEFQAPASAAL
ncbi:hypothetical protein GGP41_007685 [Bipolaris sorokiniana]|uniref:Uncharacterized protein n=1 Tax=Cochliobolus sativus TaxID=45130 RepID=A0A8H5Z733_COCSA|nr:hypothetical protein GGP41_007685 [Bipolaris sorokiniana]